MMGRTDLAALNAALFRELERVEACGSKEELESECRRAKAVSDLAGNIIANGRTAVEAARLSMDVGMAVRTGEMLLGGDDD